MRPLVYIIDKNENFAEFLEQKFLERYDDKVDLRIITDVQYLQRLFSARQRADCVMVSESLYDNSFHMHDFARTIVLCEGSPSGIRDMLQENHVSVFSKTENHLRILDAAMAGIDVEARKTGAKIVTVTSAIGGSGKTAVALALAIALSVQKSQRVLYISTEEVQSFSYYLGDDRYLAYKAGLLLAQKGPGIYQRMKEHMRKGIFTYLPETFFSPAAMGIQTDAYIEMIKEAKASGDYDMILLDIGSMNGGNAAYLDESDHVLVLVLQDLLSVSKTNTLCRNINVYDEKFHFVCNRYQKKPDFLPEKETGNFSVEFHIAEMADMKPGLLSADKGIAGIARLLL